MKNIRVILIAVVVIMAGLFAFRNPWAGSVRGVVVPVDGAVRAWALSSTDTFRANIAQGTFEITGIKPGIYRIIIEAVAPYKNMAKDSIAVADNTATDAGTFTLIK